MTIDLEWLKKPVQARTVTILELTLECETLRAELRRLRSERDSLAEVATTMYRKLYTEHMSKEPDYEAFLHIEDILARSLSAPQAQGGSK